MKIALAQIDCHIGNFEFNTAKIIKAIDNAKAEGADVVVFPELAICGYPPLDFLDFDHFITLCEQHIKDIAAHCNDVAAIVGGPSRNSDMLGKDIFNSAWFLADGEVKSIVTKSLLPTYDVFDEYRYFEHGKQHHCIQYKGCRIALTVCEDLWDLQENPMYTINPMDRLMAENPDVMINIAASPFSYTQSARRFQELKKNVLKYKLPLFYVNHAGAQTEIVFDGGSLVFCPDGGLYKEMKYFEEDLQVFDLDTVKMCNRDLPETKYSKYDLIYKALVLGVKDYFGKQGFSKAVLGLSGGIDSAVVHAIAAEALGAENVLAVLMPSQYTAELSNTEAEKLAKNLGSLYKIIPISKPYETFKELLQEHFEGKPYDIAEENLQARSRGLIVMAFANKFGNILLNTSNKSELAVGYGTLYGDMAGGLSVIGDLYKTEVYELARYINREKEIIPESIITREPSAELRPGQKDSDSLPPYDILDKILFHYIEKRNTPQELIKVCDDEKLVKRVLRMVNNSEYKRYQFAPILRVSEKAFGLGRRMPLVAKYLGYEN